MTITLIPLLESKATCQYCGQEMLPENGCTCKKVKVHGKTMDRLVNKEQDPCHDCGVKDGLLHHPHCDLERCPECGGQMLMHILDGKATFRKKKKKDKKVSEGRIRAGEVLELLEGVRKGSGRPAAS
jgi:hypothetical protein